jgi:hypothetical protein
VTDWQDLRETFYELSDHPRYFICAREMDTLVVALQDDPVLDEAEVTAAYLYLTITLPDCDGSIIIHNKKRGRSVVELYRGEWGEHYVDGESNVTIEVLHRLIHHYLHRIEEMYPAT